MELENKIDQLGKKLKRLALTGVTSGYLMEIVQGEDIPEDVKESIYDVIIAFKLVEERIRMTVNNTNNIGGDSNAPIGQGQDVVQEVGHNQVTVTRIQKSVHIDKGIQEKLILVKNAIQASNLNDSMKKLANTTLDSLTEELDKPQPEPSNLQLIWTGLKGFASDVKPIAELGLIMTKILGIAFGVS